MDPHALVCQVLLAAYFRNGDFLSAKFVYNPSYTWTGIMEARYLLKKGVRWKVATGDNISVWRDPWLNCEWNFCIQTPHLHELETLKVSKAYDLWFEYMESRFD